MRWHARVRGPNPAPGGLKGGPAAPPAATVKPEDRPVADLALMVLVKDYNDIVQLTDTMKKDRHFGKVESAMKGSLSGVSDRTPYEIRAEILSWPTDKFSRVLDAKFPVPPKAPPVDPDNPPADPDPVPAFDPFNPGGGFDPFNPGGNTP